MSKVDDRPYQAESIEDLRQGFREKHGRQILAAPTGAGKSVMMLDLIKGAIKKGSRVMFICERRILVEQFSKHLDAMGIDHGVLMDDHWRFRPGELVQVASAQTLEKMESWPAFDICFIDEIHACMRASIKKLMDGRPSLRVIGATATPFHPELGKYFTRVTSVISMAELVERNYLVPFRVFVAHEIDTTDVPVIKGGMNKGEWDQKELAKRGQQIVGDVVADYIKISNEVFGGYRKTICFSCGVAHGADLAQKFNEAGINAVQISANDEDIFRAEVLAEFAKPDSEIKVVISVAILSRGFDQTDVEHVILARPLKKSFSEHVQMVGRGARAHPDKKFCVVQDNSGNWLRFRDSWDDLYTNGVRALSDAVDKKSRKEPTEQEKSAAKCPRCGHLWGNADVCSHCGAVRVRRNEVMAVAGEMTELTLVPKKEKYTPEYKRDFYAQLLGFAAEKNHAPGSAYHRYIEKFGVGPSMAKPAPMPPGVEVLNWIKSRHIARARARKAA